MGYSANIQRKGAEALFDIKGAQSKVEKYAGASLPTFPKSANTATIKGDVSLLHVGRDHWLVRAPLHQEPALEDALRPAHAPADISVVRISDTLVFFSVTGPDADQVIMIATTLDIHASVFPETGAAFTDIFGLKGLTIWQPDGFMIAVEQSFGDMIEDYLSRAMA
jgi:heterotetrameric sarcosine oxidase gamma subunit